MQSGLAAAQEGEWDSALNWLGQAEAANPGAIEVRQPAQAIESIVRHVNGQRQQIDRAMAQGDSQRALALALSLDEFTERAVETFTALQNGGHDEHPGNATPGQP
jgi:hypothetical protein